MIIGGKISDSHFGKKKHFLQFEIISHLEKLLL